MWKRLLKLEPGGNYIREEERGLLIATSLGMERTFCFKLMLVAHKTDQ